MVMRGFAASPNASPGTPRGHITTIVRADVKTGRLVRSIVVAPQIVSTQPAATPKSEIPSQATGTAGLTDVIDRIAGEQGVEGPLVHSVIRAESNYNPSAISPKGAMGVMQLIPSTAKRFGVSDVFDPADNIQGGVKYLRFLLDYYGGDYSKAIAAYNAGEAAVDKYNGVPPYSETRNYVLQVAKNLRAARAGRPKPAGIAPEAGKSGQGAETRKPIITSVGSDGRVYYRTP